MAKPVELQTSFSRGMVQDRPRYALPKGASWNIVDWLPDYQDNLRKRGGWGYAVGALSTNGATQTVAVGYANFVAGDKIVAITDNQQLWSVAATASAATAVAVSAASSVPKCDQTPVMFHDKLILPLGGAGTIKYFDGTSVVSITAAPVDTQRCAVYKDRVLLGRNIANPERVFFSAASDPLTWDTTNSWISVTKPVSGIAALPGSLLIFMNDRTARVRGSIPPPGSDFIIDDPIFNIGCTDARSIAVQGPYVIFANGQGVYRSNGSNIPEDLTAACGLKKYWRDILSGYDGTGASAAVWRLSGGMLSGKYYVSVMNGGAFVDALWFDIDNRVAGRISNWKALGCAAAVARQEELYFAMRLTARVGKLSTILSPSSTTKNDDDGTAIAPILETPFYLDTKTGKKRWKAMYCRYDTRDAATDNPSLTISYATDPNGAYTALSPSLAESTTIGYVRRNLRISSDGIGFKIQQTNASSDSRLVSLSADVLPREGSRVA